MISWSKLFKQSRRERAGIDNLEDAFVRLIGSEEGLHA